MPLEVLCLLIPPKEHHAIREMFQTLFWNNSLFCSLMPPRFFPLVSLFSSWSKPPVWSVGQVSTRCLVRTLWTTRVQSNVAQTTCFALEIFGKIILHFVFNININFPTKSSSSFFSPMGSVTGSCLDCFKSYFFSFLFRMDMYGERKYSLLHNIILIVRQVQHALTMWQRIKETQRASWCYNNILLTHSLAHWLN